MSDQNRETGCPPGRRVTGAVTGADSILGKVFTIKRTIKRNSIRNQCMYVYKLASQNN